MKFRQIIKFIYHIVLLCSSISTVFAESNLSIGDFDNKKNQLKWTLVKDLNAKGELNFTTRKYGKTANLSWDVTAGGRWIGAEKQLLQIPTDAKGIRLKIKTSGVSTAWLYLSDSLGIYSKYRLSRSLTDLHEGEWFSQTVSLSTHPDSLLRGKFDSDFKKKLRSITIAIEPRMDPWYPQIRWLPQPKGEMWFDDVEWIMNYNETLKFITKPVLEVPTSNLWGRTGVCTHFENGDLNQPDSLKSVGFNAVRADILWTLVEKEKGKYDYKLFDSIVRIAESRNIRSLLILDYSNSLYTKDKLPPLSDNEIQAFGKYCATTARFFKNRAVDFEVWNEPNLKYTWNPVPNALQFSKLLKVAVDSVKNANPKAKVISGGTAGIDWRFIDSLGVSGALKRVDGIGIHPYRMGSPESFSEDLLALRWLTKKYFDNYPAEWATEYGATSSNYGEGFSLAAQQWQARIDVRALLSNWLAGFAYSHKYEFFTWGNDPKDNENHYGIFGQDLKARPSYKAIKELKHLTQNRQFVGRLKTINSGAYALQFNGKNDKLIVLYTSVGKLSNDTTGYKTRYLLPKKPKVLYNIYGKEFSTSKDKDGKWPVEADGEVVYAIIPND